MGDRRYIVIRRGVSVTQHLFLSIIPLTTSLTQNSGQKPTVNADGGISLVHEQANV